MRRCQDVEKMNLASVSHPFPVATLLTACDARVSPATWTLAITGLDSEPPQCPPLPDDQIFHPPPPPHDSRHPPSTYHQPRLRLRHFPPSPRSPRHPAPVSKPSTPISHVRGHQIPHPTMPTLSGGGTRWRSWLAALRRVRRFQGRREDQGRGSWC